jgi:choline dehydrogenase-like flavoprotein
MDVYDIAIVGTGMGGATLGHALAMAGRRVLFLEKGFREAKPTSANAPGDMRLASYRWPHPITGDINGRRIQKHFPLGCGVGGSTLHYNGTLERMEPLDFASWPFSFRDMSPFYREAERLFGVIGSSDPLSESDECALVEPPPLSSRDEQLFSSLRASGLHPYNLHRATKLGNDPGTRTGSARDACVEPAIRSGNADVLDNCTVVRIEASGGQVRWLDCVHNGYELRIQARIYALAGGALNTPALLLKSANRECPSGVANSSGLVGRNLMFHQSDYFAVWPAAFPRQHGSSTAICFRDFYNVDDAKMGVVQSTGLNANAPVVAQALRDAWAESPYGRLPVVARMLRLPASLLCGVFREGAVLATILEDRPYADNRVLLDRNDPNSFTFTYTIREELRERVALLRSYIRRVLRGHILIWLSRELNLNFGHPCGTCVAGTDPGASVIDAFNKAHDLENLYIVDASFFPTSGGINPSLTIAANALRVASHLQCLL